ncbi:MAG: hypothetical protein NVSMB29_07330 [Candidatus Dormibacteria bacterium]
MGDRLQGSLAVADGGHLERRIQPEPKLNEAAKGQVILGHEHSSAIRARCGQLLQHWRSLKVVRRATFV